MARWRIQSGCTTRRVRVATLAAGVIACVVLASPAFAYQHHWSCNAAAGAQCFDTTGTQYNPWSEVDAFMQTTSDSVCAKGVTAAGSRRTSGTGDCSYFTTSHVSCFYSSSPDSQAYVYWSGPGTVRFIEGYAETPASQVGC